MRCLLANLTESSGAAIVGIQVVSPEVPVYFRILIFNGCSKAAFLLFR